MYAVVSTGSKQVKVFEGDRVRIDRVDAPIGDLIALERVCLLVTDDGVVADPKALAPAKVVCEVTAHDRAKKIRVFKKKRRKTYARTQGHRQAFTEVIVRDIQQQSAAAAAPAPAPAPAAE